MSAWEPESSEPDEFARTDLRTGLPALERPRRSLGRGFWRRLRAHVTLPRAVITTIAAIASAAIVATQVGYTQRLIDATRYRVNLLGVPELTETTIAPQRVAYLTTAGWERIPLPAPAHQIKTFSADPAVPASLLVCGLSRVNAPTVNGKITPRGPIGVWLTHDAGKTWSRGLTPEIVGTFCWISRAADAPQRLALLIEHPATIAPRCAEYNILLSDDNGVNWRVTPAVYAPVADEVEYCSHFAFIARERLYLHTNWTTSSSGQTTPDLNTSLARSDDGGRHWSEVSGDLAQYLSFRATFLPDGTIITARWPTPQEEPEDTSVLWASTDIGDTWRPLSVLLGIVAQDVIASLGARSARATADQPLYLKAAQIIDDRHWAFLPPLPVKGASVDHVGITNILGATASGKLLAFGVGPMADVTAFRLPDEDFAQQWLWSWDPRAARWTSLAPPLPVPWKRCSDGCWQATFVRSPSSQGTVLWVRGVVSENGDDELYRFSVPAEIA
jgi:hypothetical protein